MNPMETMDHQVVYTIKFVFICILLYFNKGFYGPPNEFYGPPFRGRGYYRRGGYGPGGDLSEQDGFNGYRGFRGFRGFRGRGRGWRRGSGRGGSNNEKFVLNQR